MSRKFKKESKSASAQSVTIKQVACPTCDFTRLVEDGDGHAKPVVKHPADEAAARFLVEDLEVTEITRTTIMKESAGWTPGEFADKVASLVDDEGNSLRACKIEDNTEDTLQLAGKLVPLYRKHTYAPEGSPLPKLTILDQESAIEETDLDTKFWSQGKLVCPRCANVYTVNL